MLLSRTQSAMPGHDGGSGAEGKRRKKRSRRKKKPKLEDYIRKRDYTGAITLLEFHRKHADEEDPELLLWLGYAYFHNGDAAAALEVYTLLAGMANNPSTEVATYRATCLFYLGEYKEAQSVAESARPSGLQNRLLFHLAHKFGNEEELMGYHRKLRDVIEDQMSLASIHYMRQHYNEAIEIYQTLLKDNRTYQAMQFYIACCYYKLDYYDSSLDLLSLYLATYPDSAVALNLKACNHFRLYDGRAAEAELKRLEDLATPSFKFAQDLIRHNMVVFRGGDNALQVLPRLVGALPEARLNLAIYYLRQDDVGNAYELMKDVDALSPQEYILKAVVNAAYGQVYGEPENLEYAQKLYQIVGLSATECDTIPGRQCMASYLYLVGEYDQVLVYLDSIKTYFYLDDDFNYNYGIAKAACGHFGDAEETLLMVQNERYRAEFCYLGWLARSYIMNGKPLLAWELYLRTESTGGDAFNLLNLIANDCYSMGHFYVAAQAFDILERTDPTPEAWDAKRGACIGVFQQIIAGVQSTDVLHDVISLLRHTPNNPQVELIIRTMTKWGLQNGLHM
ncbi:tetratricopeptide repeat protein 26 [Thecamonas trahens ATCC 50062]|uniref:Tetratricopeptide repeat protein 26 n=1 Tax=Thecamonas trahens ATCC 50062 TaxID=461836 RepID=A0A0L0DRP8_THETB|nr:tetratricopeptide repeat protein 26 [Thecamonas trahens ATCC 50062]KNC54970.1 tetratricopeptide repeat protein 26 [Thecamonas trahens ATCC 50062]|eukprot:XP_013753417.1 tetratricopeptide repeat protein 26 [Thecamonas trahens ATCC 50062]